MRSMKCPLVRPDGPPASVFVVRRRSMNLRVAPTRCARLSRRPLPFTAKSGRIMAGPLAPPALRLAALEIGPQRGLQTVFPAIGLELRHVTPEPSRPRPHNRFAGAPQPAIPRPVDQQQAAGAKS